MEDKEIIVTDVLEVAVRLERLGLKFFKSVSELDLSEDIKELFNFLASEEEKHTGIYSTMLDNISDYHSQYKYPGEYGKFIDAYAKMVFMKIVTSSKFSDSIKEAVSNIDHKSKDFFDKLVGLHDFKTAEDALNIARELEISAIVFYSEALSLFKEKDQFILNLIIKEEKEHLRKINDILKLVTKNITK